MTNNNNGKSAQAKQKAKKRTQPRPSAGRITALKRSALLNQTAVEDPDVRKYALALTDPFNPNALGARVPDQYACPTSTHVVRASLTITCNSSGNAGCIITPNPLVGIALFNGTGSDFETTTFGDGTTSTFSRWGVDPTTFAQKFDTYRVVGMGARITGLSSMTNSSGKITMGAFPNSTTWMTKDFKVGGNTMATVAAAKEGRHWGSLGVPNNGTTNTLYPQLMVSLPGSKVVSAIQASENVFQVVPRISSPAALHFRQAADSTQGWDYAAGATTSGDAGYLTIDGFESSFFYYTGGVASTSTIDVEVIWHLEGKMDLSAGITTQTSSIQASTTDVGTAINPLAATAVQAVASAQHPVSKVVPDDSDGLGPMFKTLGGALKVASALV